MRTSQTAPKNMDEYIADFPQDVQAILEKIRTTVRKAAPGAQETINYRIPTFTLKGNLVHFAAFKKHIGFYPTSTGIEKFKNELSVYKGAKGSVQFPFDKPIPYGLISQIVKFRVKENLARAEAKGKKKQRKHSMPTIETRRLRLRPMTFDDLSALARLWSDPEVMRYLPTGEPRTVQETQVELDYMVSHWQVHGFGVWAILLKETNEFVGYCGLQYLHEEPGGVTAEALQGGTDVEVIAGLAKPYWKQGIAPEATRAALRYGFETVRLARVVAAIHPENDASRHILQEMMGMQHDEKLDYYGDCPHFVIRRDEFQLDDSFYLLYS